MDETSMVLGWLMGRRIAGQRKKQEKQPIGYLYSGVTVPDVPEYDSSIVLPKLPEWEEETYPKALLFRGHNSYGIESGREIALICTKSPVDWSFISVPAGEYRLFLIDLDAEETKWEEGSASENFGLGTGFFMPVWANYEVSGSTYWEVEGEDNVWHDFILTPADPIPVYDP